MELNSENQDQATKAKIIALWVGEINPDRFSSVIQLVLSTGQLASTFAKLKLIFQILFLNGKYLVEYSHNAFIFEGEVWHGTINSDARYNGFCNEPLDSALAGCVVRYCREVETRFTPAELRVYLQARKGIPYSMRQNLAAIRPVLLDHWFTAWFFKNGKSAVNCSEVVAEVASSPSLVFGDLDKVKPTDTFRVIRPDLCQHDHIKLNHRGV